MPARIRIDRLLVERGLFESRAKAQAAIADGLVTADDIPVTKPSAEIAADAVLRAEPAHPWVSRAGVKLAAALDHLGIDLAGRVCLDVGASTGGFTEVMLAARRAGASTRSTSAAASSIRGCATPRDRFAEATDIRDSIRRGSPSGPTSSLSTSASSRSSSSCRRRSRSPNRARICVALVKPQFETGGRHSRRRRSCAIRPCRPRSARRRRRRHSLARLRGVADSPPRSSAATATANSSSARAAASAADLTFLSVVPQVRHRNVKSKAALES